MYRLIELEMSESSTVILVILFDTTIFLLRPNIAGLETHLITT